MVYSSRAQAHMPLEPENRGSLDRSKHQHCACQLHISSHPTQFEHLCVVFPTGPLGPGITSHLCFSSIIDRLRMYVCVGIAPASKVKCRIPVFQNTGLFVCLAPQQSNESLIKPVMPPHGDAAPSCATFPPIFVENMLQVPTSTTKTNFNKRARSSR